MGQAGEIEERVETRERSFLEIMVGSALISGAMMGALGLGSGILAYPKELFGNDSVKRTEAISYTITTTCYGFGAGALGGAGIFLLDYAVRKFDRNEEDQDDE